jgi:ATP phosphoribosyltransferase
MLRIAIPNKGSLSEPATAMLHEAGYASAPSPRNSWSLTQRIRWSSSTCAPGTSLSTSAPANSTSASPAATCCWTPQLPPKKPCRWASAHSTFRYAALPGTATTVHDLTGMTIATSYPGVVAKHLASHGVDGCKIVRLDGAVETSLQLGVAQAIADVVETGATLAHLGLQVIGDPIMESEGIVIRPAPRPYRERKRNSLPTPHRKRPGRPDLRHDGLQHPHRKRAGRCGPHSGLESPTVSPLHRDGWAAVRAMVPAKQAQRIMDELEAVGAHAILATSIHACRI